MSFLRVRAIGGDSPCSPLQNPFELLYYNYSQLLNLQGENKQLWQFGSY